MKTSALGTKFRAGPLTTRGSPCRRIANEAATPNARDQNSRKRNKSVTGFLQMERAFLPCDGIHCLDEMDESPRGNGIVRRSDAGPSHFWIAPMQADFGACMKE